VDGAALPLDVQRTIALAQATQRAPWDPDGASALRAARSTPDGTAAPRDGASAPEEAPLDFALAMSANAPREELEASGRIDPALAARFVEAESTALPRLRDRPEDLRAIVSDRLAREGLRVRGAPLGLDDAAYARLLDYPFDGEDVELWALVHRLVAACDGDVVRARHVDAVLAAGGAVGVAQVALDVARDVARAGGS
jgi:DNA-binding NtrC family response regulator